MAMEVPHLEFGEMVRATRVRKEAAGKGINVSRVLRELGEPTTALAILGQGSVHEFQRLAREAGIPIVYISISGETRTNIHVVEATTGRSLKINQQGPVVEAAQFDHFLLLFRQQLRTARMAALGGSLPPGLAVDCYARLVEAATRAGVPTIVDTEGPALMAALEAKPYLAKPNRRELAGALGRQLLTTDDMVDGAREMQRRGARGAIVTDAEGAVVAVMDDEAWIAHPPRIKARSSLGAGDSLAAGIAAGVVRGLGFGEALRLGVACGTATCLAPDTELARRADIDRLRGEVVIEQLA
jgi:1-phosphofructokinase family hexose kinase